MDPEEYVKDAWDIHVHASPSLFPRWGDVIDLAREGSAHSMAGIVLKYHHGSSVEAAYLANKVTGDITVYGGVTLNYPVGGLNPSAVETSIALGGKIVWLPTIHASNHEAAFGVLGGFQFQKSAVEKIPDKGISILNRRNGIVRNLRDILDILHNKSMVLATGHISTDEIYELKKYINNEHLNIPLLINHALFKTTSMDERQVKELSDGKTWFETVYLTVSPVADPVPVKHVAKVIGNTHEAQWIIASDSGQINNVKSPSALDVYARMLENEGIDKGRILRMLKNEPKSLLNI